MELLQFYSGDTCAAVVDIIKPRHRNANRQVQLQSNSCVKYLMYVHTYERTYFVVMKISPHVSYKVCWPFASPQDNNIVYNNVNYTLRYESDKQRIHLGENT